MHLDFSSVVVVTCDTEHLLTLKISNTNLKNYGGLEVSWEATPEESDSVRTTTNKGMPKMVHARTVIFFDTLFNGPCDL